MRVEMPDEEQQLAASIVHDDTEQLDAAQEQMLGGIASAIAHIVSGFARGELIAHYAVTDVLAQTLHVQVPTQNLTTSHNLTTSQPHHQHRLWKPSTR